MSVVRVVRARTPLSRTPPCTRTQTPPYPSRVPEGAGSTSRSRLSRILEDLRSGGGGGVRRGRGVRVRGTRSGYGDPVPQFSSFPPIQLSEREGILLPSQPLPRRPPLRRPNFLHRGGGKGQRYRCRVRRPGWRKRRLRRGTMVPLFPVALSTPAQSPVLTLPRDP